MKSIYKLYWENQCDLNNLLVRSKAINLVELLMHRNRYPADIQRELDLIHERRSVILMKLAALEGRSKIEIINISNVVSMENYRLPSKK